MELFFLALLILLLIGALGSGYPVAFALPGSAIITIGAAALFGLLFEGNTGAYFAHGDPTQWLNAAVTNFRGIYFEVERDTLIAIPLFVFMGIMLQRSKIAEDLLVAMAQLFGPIPGGLGISVIFVGALLAATTGIVGATVIAMGLISLPVMLRHKYNIPLATGTISASGTLGQIIPPSIVLIILADQLSSATDQGGTLRQTEYKELTGSFSMPNEFGLSSTSAGEMFLGAMVPGLVLVGLYMVYILAVAIISPKSAPPVPFEGNYDKAFYRQIVLALVPPLALIFAVLGSIVLGIATVNQAGAVGAIGAMTMAGYRLMEGKKNAFYPAVITIGAIIVIGVLLSIYDINIKSNENTAEDVWVIAFAVIAVFFLLIGVAWSGWRVYKVENTLTSVMVETAKTTSLVFIILLGAAMLTAAFRAFGGEELVKDFLTGLPGGFIGKFIVVMAVIFVLGFFLDFIEIAVVVVPIIAPILLADTSANITGVWLGVMVGLNMQTSFLTPPFGFALFYLRGVAPPIVKTLQMYKGVVPFIILQLVGLAIVGLFPSLVNYLPNVVNLTSETAPPPRNPRLQMCVEEYLFPLYAQDKPTILSAIDKAKALNISYLPSKYRSALTESFTSAEKTFDLIEEVKVADTNLKAYEPEYRPLHIEVRSHQREARQIDEDIKKIETEIRDKLRLDEKHPEVPKLKAHIEELKAHKQAILVDVPENWEAARKQFLELAKADKNARRKYQRNVDDAYAPIPELIKVLEDTENLAALESKLKSVEQMIALPEDEAIEAIKSIEAEFSAVEGSSPIKSKVSKVRRALKGSNRDPEEARKAFGQSLEAFTEEVTWRKKASDLLTSSLREYELAIKGTIGLRSQERLTDKQAEEIASCLSVHRDISLYF